MIGISTPSKMDTHKRTLVFRNGEYHHLEEPQDAGYSIPNIERLLGGSAPNIDTLEDFYDLARYYSPKPRLQKILSVSVGS